MSDDKNYVGGFGPRYGRKIRSRVSEVEKKQRARQDCPKCGKAAQRISSGIYECPKCGKFTGGAYSI
jgi:large subunit ribosomal protein L37Ae